MQISKIMGVVDTRSRRTLSEFAIQTCVGLALMVVVSLVRSQTSLEFGQAMVRVFQFYGLMDCCRAVRRRDPVGGPSLNLWDQAMAYTGLGFLCHAITG